MRAIIRYKNHQDTTKMQIALIVNPRSGRGKADKAASLLNAELAKRGHKVSTLEMGTDHSTLQSQIADADRVVVLGGDGTVHHLLEILADTQTPMYHFGTGTANLICKAFGMAQSPEQVAAHLEAEIDPIRVDLPTCNGRPFLIMVSLGIDASVIHRFEEARSRKGGYRAYIQPVLREVISPRPARFMIETNTHPPAQPPAQHAGILVIANLRSYGGGFNPCPDANPTDGQLDAVVIPCTSSIGAGISYGFLKARRTSSKMKRFVSDSFRITSKHTPAFVQVDGEKASRVPGLVDGRLEPGNHLEIAMSKRHILIHAPKYQEPEERQARSDNVSSVKWSRGVAIPVVQVRHGREEKEDIQSEDIQSIA